MKSVILVAVVLFASVSGNAQTLKELLYGGKLKKDSSGVIRKSDDLASKIDTSTKKPEAEKPQTAPVTATTNSNPPSAISATTDESIKAADSMVVAPVTDPAAANVAEADKPKSNNAVWKSYIDELIGTLKSEVMTNKKIKNGTYSVLIDYAIEVDGTITVNSVSSVPENSYLQEQIKQRLTLTAPTLTPLLGTNGKPRKAPKKQTITLSK